MRLFSEKGLNYKPIEFLSIFFLIVLFGALLRNLSVLRDFDQDEFQHIEMAWLISTGAIPYKDFFENHTPLYHFLLGPFFDAPLLQTDGSIAARVVLNIRMFSVVSSIAILVLTYICARRIASGFAAITAVCLLMGAGIFIEKGIEIRPDQIATIFLLASSILLLPGPKKAPDSRHVFVAFLFATLAVFTTQKTILAMPGLLVSFAMRHFPLKLSNFQDMLKEGVWIFLAVVFASIPIGLYFFLHNALWDFFYDNFFIVAKWVHDSYPLVLGRLLRQDAILVIFAFCGLYACLQKREWIPITAPLLSMVLFMPVFPVIQRQYVFLFLPYLAIVGGLGADILLQGMSQRVQKPFLPRFLPATILLTVLILHAVAFIINEKKNINTVAFDKLRYVVEKTSPDSTVLRGWSRGVAFRKPAFRYFSLHREFRALISADEFNALAQGLKDCTVAPEVIEMDADLQSLPDNVVSILRQKWEPTGVDDLWRIKK